MNKTKFKEGLCCLINNLNEWPHRPLDSNTSVREEASFIIVNNNFLVPIYPDDPRIELAGLIGFTKQEFMKAKGFFDEKTQYER